MSAWERAGITDPALFQSAFSSAYSSRTTMIGDGCERVAPRSCCGVEDTGAKLRASVEGTSELRPSTPSLCISGFNVPDSRFASEAQVVDQLSYSRGSSLAPHTLPPSLSTRPASQGSLLSRLLSNDIVRSPKKISRQPAFSSLEGGQLVTWGTGGSTAGDGGSVGGGMVAALVRKSSKLLNKISAGPRKAATEQTAGGRALNGDADAAATAANEAPAFLQPVAPLWRPGVDYDVDDVSIRSRQDVSFKPLLPTTPSVANSPAVERGGASILQFEMETPSHGPSPALPSIADRVIRQPLQEAPNDEVDTEDVEDNFPIFRIESSNFEPTGGSYRPHSLTPPPNVALLYKAL